MLGAQLVEALPEGLAGDVLVLAEVLEHAEFPPVVQAGVEADDGDAGRLGLGHRSLHGVGLGRGERDAVDLLVDGVLHQVGLVSRDGVAGVDELDVVLRGSGLRPLADQVPEGVAGCRVGDHGDGHPRGGGLARRGVGAPGLGLLPAGAAGAAGGEQRAHEGGGGQGGGSVVSAHVGCTSLCGERVPRPARGGGGPLRTRWLERVTSAL